MQSAAKIEESCQCNFIWEKNAISELLGVCEELKHLLSIPCGVHTANGVSPFQLQKRGTGTAGIRRSTTLTATETRKALCNAARQLGALVHLEGCRKHVTGS